MGDNGQEEYFVEKIIDSKCSCLGAMYLVGWLSYGPDADEWLPKSDVIDLKVFNDWLREYDLRYLA